MRDDHGPAPGWQVYILRCADGTLYTGIALDARRRAAEHNAGGPRAARYTRPRRPVTLVHIEDAVDRAAAARREHEIKSLPRAAKLLLVNGPSGGKASRRRRVPRPRR